MAGPLRPGVDRLRSGPQPVDRPGRRPHAARVDTPAPGHHGARVDQPTCHGHEHLGRHLECRPCCPKPEPTGSARTPVPSIAALKDAARSHPDGGPVLHPPHRHPLPRVHRRRRARSWWWATRTWRRCCRSSSRSPEAATTSRLYTWMSYVCPWERGVLPASSDQRCRPERLLSRCAERSVRHGDGGRYKPDVTIVVNRGYDDPNFPPPAVHRRKSGRPYRSGPRAPAGDAQRRRRGARPLPAPHRRRAVAVADPEPAQLSGRGAVSGAVCDERQLSASCPRTSAIERRRRRRNPQVASGRSGHGPCARGCRSATRWWQRGGRAPRSGPS